MPTGHLLFFASPKNENLYSLSARLLLYSLNAPTALPSPVNRTTINLAWRLVFVFTEYKIRCADNEYRFWQKKGDPNVQVWLRQTSRRLHPFFGACELAALCASSDKRTLFPEKRMLRSAGRRGVAAILNICEALGSLKANPFSTKPFGSTLNGFVFQAAFGFARFSGCLICQFFQFVHQI